MQHDAMKGPGPLGKPTLTSFVDRNGQEPDYLTNDPRPWKIHRRERGRICWYQRWLEAWWIVTGRWSLHRAWQHGLDHGVRMEYHRTVVRGGR